eukprot:7578243-Karenia_brevis.AAC.1
MAASAPPETAVSARGEDGLWWILICIIFFMIPKGLLSLLARARNQAVGLQLVYHMVFMKIRAK